MPIARKCARAPARSGAGRELGAGPAAKRVLRCGESRAPSVRWHGGCVSGLFTTAAHQRRDPRRAARRTRRSRSSPSARATRARAQAYAHENGIERAHGSYEELLGDPERRRGLHRAAGSAPPHVDDARARTPASTCSSRSRTPGIPNEVDEAHDEAERRGLVLTEAYMWRHPRRRSCSASCCRGWASSGPCTRRSPDRSRAPTTSAGLPELGGGALLDLGCYCISAARLVPASRTRVTARRRRKVGSTGVRRRPCSSGT